MIDLPQTIELWPIERFQDKRGWFMPISPSTKPLEEKEWRQENVSYSKKGVLRGLHFQNPQPQAKLLTVLQGEIFDVALDVQRDSPNFGKHTTCTLKESDQHQLYIPSGFAHGFYVLSNFALIHYKCSALWEPSNEKTILWNDPALQIQWPLTGAPVISEKDVQGRSLSSFALEELPTISR